MPRYFALVILTQGASYVRIQRRRVPGQPVVPLKWKKRWDEHCLLIAQQRRAQLHSVPFERAVSAALPPNSHPHLPTETLSPQVSLTLEAEIAVLSNFPNLLSETLTQSQSLSAEKDDIEPPLPNPHPHPLSETPPPQVVAPSESEVTIASIHSSRRYWTNSPIVLLTCSGL